MSTEEKTTSVPTPPPNIDSIVPKKRASWPFLAFIFKQFHAQLREFGFFFPKEMIIKIIKTYRTIVGSKGTISLEDLRVERSELDIFGPIQTDPLSAPRDLVVNSKNQLLVSDQGRGRIAIFDMKGKRLRTIPAGHPLGITIDEDDNMWVVNDSESKVAKLDHEGKLLKEIGISVLECPWAVIRNDIGEIYVSDNTHRVVVFDEEGKVLRTIGGPGPRDGLFHYPRGLAIYGGLLYVSDHGNNRIQVFTQEGQWLRSWGTQSTGPLNIDIDDDGKVVVGGYDNRIEVYTLEGQQIKEVRYPGGHLMGLKIHNGVLYTSDYSNHEVVVYRPPQVREEHQT